MLINDKCNEHRREPVPARLESCATCKRIRLEEQIAGKVVRALLKARFVISVHDSESFVVSKSKDAAKILAAMFTSDDDRLYVRSDPDGPHVGWVWLVYGNDGWDVVSDYTTNLEPVLKPVFDWIDRNEG